MERLLKKVVEKFRAEFSWKAYFLLTGVLFAVTFIRPEFPLFNTAPYQYCYGVGSPWITIYQSADFGQKSIWFHLLHGNLGISFEPLAIFWSSFLIYVGYLLLVFATEGIRRKMFPPRLQIR